MPDDYPGHEINRTGVSNGVSYLRVRTSSSLENDYRCIVRLANGVWDQSKVMLSPQPASKLLHYTHMYIQDCVLVYTEC